MFRSIAPQSTGEIWPYAAPEHAADRGPVWRSAWHAIGSGVRACFAAIAERRSLRRAERELASLDDRMLKDIGIQRTEIVHVVRYGRSIL